MLHALTDNGNPAALLLVPVLLGWLVLLTIDTVGRAVRLGRVTAPARFVGNVASWGVELGSRHALFPLRALVFLGVYAWVPWRIPTSVASLALLWLLADLTYYWKHRLLHTNRLLWTLHEPHHSIEEVTAESALRLGWIQRNLDDFFYLWLVLLGFDPWWILLTVEVVHLAQWWTHNEWLGRIPWLDPWLNTPSNHRVHHAREPALHNANYAANLILWDKLFGTYVPEPDGLAEFGADTGYHGNNPLRFQFTGLVRYLRGAR